MTKITGRYFIDGGLEHNNPTFAIYYHYSAGLRKGSTKLHDSSAQPTFSHHGDLDCSLLRFTNVGTGAKVDEIHTGKRARFASLMPGVIRYGVFLAQALKDIASSSSNTRDAMALMADVDNNDANTGMFYARFDANHGVSKIRLDDHHALESIREKTKLYLAEDDTKASLKAVAWNIASDYFQMHPTSERIPEGPSPETIDAGPASSSISSNPSGHSLPKEEALESHDIVQNGGPRPSPGSRLSRDGPGNAHGVHKGLDNNSKRARIPQVAHPL